MRETLQTVWRFVLVVVALGACDALAQGSPQGLVPQIYASGLGEIRLAPDRVRIVLGVETAGPEAAPVGLENAQRMTKLVVALQKQGVPTEQIQTVGYSIRNQQRHNPKDGKTENWFVGRNLVRLDYDDLSRLGGIIDAALSSGANQVDQLTFGLREEADARRRALAAAVLNARSQAETMAQAAGGRLGELIDLRSDPPRPIPAAAAAPFTAESRAAVAPDTPISRTEIVITQTVQARWRFVAP